MTQDTVPDPTPQPGETVPAARRLAQAPGDRYRVPPPAPVVGRPDLVRATLLGLAAALAPALLTGFLLAVLSIREGLIVAAALGGWLVGVGVRTGAWRGRPHRPSRAPLALAALLGAVAWVLGLATAWVLSMAILPASTMGFLDRLAANGFLDWVSPQLTIAEWIQLAVLVAVAWVAAHTTSLERAAARRMDG